MCKLIQDKTVKMCKLISGQDRQPHSLPSFGLCVGLCDLAMCVVVEHWHFISNYIFHLVEIVNLVP